MNLDDPVKKEYAVHRLLLLMFVLAAVVCGMTMAPFEASGAAGPMIVREEEPVSKGSDQGPLFIAIDVGNGLPPGTPAAEPAPGNPVGGPALAPEAPGGTMPDGQQGAQPGIAADDASAPVDIPPDQVEIYREVRNLQEIVNRLRLEADARDHLRATVEDEEARDRDAEILEAAGRQYYLQPPWVFGLDLSVNYSYYAYDLIRYIDRESGNNLEYHSNHTITNNFSLSSGIRENLSAGATIPFVYKYDMVGTAQSREVTSLGDISLNLQYQPMRVGQGYPSPIFSFGYIMPTGKSPYEINPQTELSTGSGLTSYTGGISLSHPFDPVNVFGSVGYEKAMTEKHIGQTRPGAPGLLDEVVPGAIIRASLGFGYAVSYRMSLTLGLSYTYMFSTDYFWLQARQYDDGFDKIKTSSGDATSASLNLSTSWRLTPGRTLIVGAGWGITAANPGFSISIRLPLSYDFR